MRHHGFSHSSLYKVTPEQALRNLLIEGLDDYSGQRLTVDFQNENLLARCGETVLCTVPDLICILERDTATPINTELLRYGFRVVVGFPAPAQLTSAQALQVVGPAAFGYDVPYCPLAPLASEPRSPLPCDQPLSRREGPYGPAPTQSRQRG